MTFGVLTVFLAAFVITGCGETEFSSKTSASITPEFGAAAGTGADVPAPIPISVLDTDPAQAAKYECGHGNNDKKIEICHVPQGNPDNRHTLCLPPPAIEAHLREHDASVATGDEDHLGACR